MIVKLVIKKFQALIGTVETDHVLARVRGVLAFQALIGTVETFASWGRVGSRPCFKPS